MKYLLLAGLFLFLATAVHADDEALLAAEQKYMDCVDPIVTKEMNRLVYEGKTINRQLIAMVLFNAEKPATRTGWRCWPSTRQRIADALMMRHISTSSTG